MEENISPPSNDSSTLSRRETRKTLTPFAFELDTSLFGSPLATPTKRFCAVLVDCAAVALLSAAPGELLAIALAITLYQMSSHKSLSNQETKKKRRQKKTIRVIGAIALCLLLIDLLPHYFDKFNNSDPAYIGANIQEEIENIASLSPSELNDLTQGTIEIANTQAPVEEKRPVYSVLEYIKSLINDLGLGFGWAAFYFTVLTSIWKGQTLGKKLFKIRVLQLDGTPLSLWDSFGRYGGYGAGIATGLLGFLQIYWDPNRQAIHDKISSTVVIKSNS